MKIIAFDLGKNFAWAHHPGRKVIAGHAMIEGARAHRLAETMRVLTELLTPLAFDLDVVVYETPFARGRDATRSLWGIAGMIEACATNAGLPCLDVAVPTIKKFATGHGKACKEDMIAAAHGFGYKGDNEHEADAVCLLRYAEANFERTADAEPAIDRRNTTSNGSRVGSQREKCGSNSPRTQAVTKHAKGPNKKGRATRAARN